MQKILLCLRQTWSISGGSYPLNSRHHAASLKFALFQPYFMVAKPGSWNQHEIGHRILKVQKFCSGTAVQIGLHWPSVSTRILSRKLSKRLSSHKDTVSTRMLQWKMCTTALSYNNVECWRPPLEQLL